MQLVANVSMLFTELPLLQRLQAAKAAGFDAVEMQFPYEVSPLLLKQELERCALELVLINLPAGDLMDGGLGLACRVERQQEFQQALEQAVNYALIVQPKLVNVLAGRIQAEEERDAAEQQLVENLKLAVSAFNPLQIKVVCEAINPLDMPGFLLNTPEQLLKVLAQVADENCQAQLDVYHMARQSLDLPSVIKQLGDQIGHVQFADNPGRAEPGTGNIDFMAAFAALKAIDYQGYISAEYRPQQSTLASLGWLDEFRKVLKS